MKRIVNFFTKEKRQKQGLKELIGFKFERELVDNKLPSGFLLAQNMLNTSRKK